MRAAAPRTAALLAIALAAAAAPPAIAEGYEVSGAPVAGAATIAEAPAIEPGLVQDSLPPPGEDGARRIYRIEVPDGARLHATALAVPLGAVAASEDYPRLDLSTRIVDSAGTSCEADVEDDVGDATTGRGTLRAWASTGVLGQEDTCAGGALFLVVTREGALHGDEEIPLELRTVIEPAGDGDASPAPRAHAVSDAGPEGSAPAQDVVTAGGASYADAAPLAPGSYRLVLAPDDTRYIAIDAAEGQRLRWRAEIVSIGHDDSSRQLVISPSNPARMRVPLAEDSEESVSATARTVLGAGYAAPISLRNRESEDPAVAGVWMPGRQVLALTQQTYPEHEDDGSPIAPTGDIEVVLTLEVEGEPVSSPEGRGIGESLRALPWTRLGLGGAAALAGLTGLVLIGLAVLRRR
ncbi:hypothetical protein [Brachybacterium hainanense]|uniref:Uncharacterized protein n=1 Tax=Brachybacterium hainanense TaxID=1541174 RepID=A0ABV6RB27_9MICO